MLRCAKCEQIIEQKYIESNGFVGNKNYNFKAFCENLYIALYSERDGFDNTALLLKELYVRSKIDGTEVAVRNGFGIFEVLLKNEMFNHVVGCERLGNGYSFRYYARLSKEFESLRRKIVPKRRLFGRDRF